MAAPAAENTIAVYEQRTLAQMQEEKRLLDKYNAQKDVIKQTVAKGATDAELTMMFALAARYRLDPFLKQIWFVPGVGVMCGRDSFLITAQRNDDFGGMISHTVCENDDVEIDAVKNVVLKHLIRPYRGKPIAAYAIVKRHGFPDVIVWCDFAEYCKQTPAWKTNPSAMILKCAESNALRRQFQVEGIQFGDPLDFNLDQREPTNVINSKPTDDPYADDTPALSAPAQEEPVSIGEAHGSAFGHVFMKAPDSAWAEVPATENQVRQIVLDCKTRDVPERLRHEIAWAIVMDLEGTGEFPEDWSTKKLTKAQASLVIDFLRNCGEESLSQAIQTAQDFANRQEAFS